MKEYSKFDSGSEWRLWDIHIHTPNTKKKDNFSGSTDEEKWNLFIEDINQAVEYSRFKKITPNKIPKL